MNGTGRKCASAAGFERRSACTTSVGFDAELQTGERSQQRDKACSGVTYAGEGKGYLLDRPSPAHPDCYGSFRQPTFEKTGPSRAHRSSCDEPLNAIRFGIALGLLETYLGRREAKVQAKLAGNCVFHIDVTRGFVIDGDTDQPAITGL